MKNLLLMILIGTLTLGGCARRSTFTGLTEQEHERFATEKRVITSQLSLGLTVEQTKKIVGRNPDEISREVSHTELPDSAMQRYTWLNKGTSDLIIIFGNGKIVEFR